MPPEELIMRWLNLQQEAIKREEERKKDIYAIEKIKFPSEVEIENQFIDIYIVGKPDVVVSDKKGFDCIKLTLSKQPPPKWKELFIQISTHTPSHRTDTDIDRDVITFNYPSSYEFSQQQADELAHAVSRTNIGFHKIREEEMKLISARREQDRKEKERLKAKKDMLNKLKFTK